MCIPISVYVMTYTDCCVSGCPIPSGSEHPVGLYNPSILNLRKLNWVTKYFWIMFSKSCEPLVTCGLRSNQLYQVVESKESDRPGTYFTFIPYSSHNDFSERWRSPHGHPSSLECGTTIAALGHNSYGFITCEKGN